MKSLVRRIRMTIYTLKLHIIKETQGQKSWAAVQQYTFFQSIGFLESNVTMCSGWRTGGGNIPNELHHRPKFLITHMRDATIKAAEIAANCITQVDRKNFTVKSQSNVSELYDVYLGDDDSMALPSCSCIQFRRSHLPSKHFAALFENFDGIDFLSLHKFYTSNPMLTVDLSGLHIKEEDLVAVPIATTYLDNVKFQEEVNETEINPDKELAPTAFDLEKSSKRV